MTSSSGEFRNFKAVFNGALEDIAKITGVDAPDGVTATLAYPSVRSFFKQYRDIHARCMKTRVEHADVRDFCRQIGAEPPPINDDQLRRLGPVFFRIASTISVPEDERT